MAANGVSGATLGFGFAWTATVLFEVGVTTVSTRPGETCRSDLINRAPAKIQFSNTKIARNTGFIKGLDADVGHSFQAKTYVLNDLGNTVAHVTLNRVYDR